LGFAIAVAGKGGSGKTTTSALIIRYLIKHGQTPILAVDADANANLGESLGMKVGPTVGGMLAAFQNDKISIPAGMTKEAYLEYRLNEVIVESHGIDLLTMGRGEGADCYCYPNTVLRKFTDSLSGNYKFTVMDNEAGMEHLSRGTTQNIDHLFIISNSTVKGVRTAARIKELVKELKLVVKNQYLVITSVPGKLDSMVEAEMARLGLVPSLLIPLDEEIAQFDLSMRPLIELPETAKSVRAVDGLLDKILPKVNAGS
jgi:CO dehydrogenase maturation factor